MGLVKHLPTSPGRRFQVNLEYSELTRKCPEKGLVTILRKKGGRNNQGVITPDHRGGNKRFYSSSILEKTSRATDQKKQYGAEVDL